MNKKSKGNESGRKQKRAKKKNCRSNLRTKLIKGISYKQQFIVDIDQAKSTSVGQPSSVKNKYDYSKASISEHPSKVINLLN